MFSYSSSTCSPSFWNSLCLRESKIAGPQARTIPVDSFSQLILSMSIHQCYSLLLIMFSTFITPSHFSCVESLLILFKLSIIIVHRSRISYCRWNPSYFSYYFLCLIYSVCLSPSLTIYLLLSSFYVSLPSVFSALLLVCDVRSSPPSTILLVHLSP